MDVRAGRGIIGKQHFESVREESECEHDAALRFGFFSFSCSFP
jgi:hypothetical protein